MASQLTKRGYKYRSLPTNDTDTFGDFLNDDSEFNIKKLDTDLEGLDEKVHLNGEKQQNFNFIENKVVQDGLVFSKIEELFTGADNYINTNIEYKHDGIYDISFKLKLPNINQGSNRGIVGILSMYEKYGWFINTLQTQHAKVSVIKNKQGEQYKVNTDFIQIFDEYISYRILIVKGLLTLYINDKLEIKDVDLRDIVLGTDKKIYIGNTGQGMYIQNGYYKDILIYNHQLTPQEIQRNLSALNNSPSIKELHTTDSTGKTSILRLASSEDHVEMASGRTLREEYMGVLKTMGKEFTSADGSPVEVPNGIEARVVNAEINGQTVKALIQPNDYYKKLGYVGSSDLQFTTIGGLYKSGYVPGTECTLVIFVTKNTCDKQVGYNVYGAVANMYFDAVPNAIPAGFTGIKKYRLTRNSPIEPHHVLATWGVPANTTGEVEFGFCILDGDYTNKELPITEPISGLSSTQAIISNNGQQYPIYEPTIQGKTRILKAPKGTQNWVEISEGETRDTTTYDYKLDSIAGDLGSVPSISDYIDRARKVKIVNTKEIVLNGNENWTMNTITADPTNIFKFIFIVDDIQLNTTPISDKLTSIVYTSSSQLTDEFIMGHQTSKEIAISLKKSKLSTPDVVGFKAWLASNPITVRYQLATPIKVPLTDEEFKAYDTHKKVISLPFEEDKVTLNDDGSVAWIEANKTTSIDSAMAFSAGRRSGDTIGFYLTLPGCVRDEIYCDKLETGLYGQYLADTITKSCVVSGSDLLVFVVLKTELETEDLNGFAKWLGSKGLITCIRKLTTPTTTHIPKELIPAILTHKTNILEVGGAVKPSSFKVTVPTTDGVKKEYTLTPINGWTGTAKANLLQTGDAELVLDLTIPEQFNTAICSLPTELRPKAERTVLGYNGNTPVVVKIGTDGTVKLPISTTGTVKLDDTYKL